MSSGSSCSCLTWVAHVGPWGMRLVVCTIRVDSAFIWVVSKSWRQGKLLNGNIPKILTNINYFVQADASFALDVIPSIVYFINTIYFIFSLNIAIDYVWGSYYSTYCCISICTSSRRLKTIIFRTNFFPTFSPFQNHSYFWRAFQFISFHPKFFRARDEK